MQEPEKEKEEKYTENKLTASDIREHILTGSPAAAVGVEDALSARLAVGAGFNIAFLSLRSAALTLLGSSCRHHVTMTEVRRLVERINYAADLFLVVEAGSGFGGDVNACRTAREFERAGADAIIFDDTRWPRENKERESEILNSKKMCSRLKAAQEGLREETLLIARTAAGKKSDNSRIIPRMKAFYEAGADILGPGEITSDKEMIRLKNAVPAPLFGELRDDRVENFNREPEKYRKRNSKESLSLENRMVESGAGFDLMVMRGFLTSERIEAEKEMLERLRSTRQKLFGRAGRQEEGDNRD
ncbi:isocitrate lyase/phosphoenolpyruvate mutase family protein [Halarsenatibacter silvermanii]|uniref:Phosphoenolpyruvate phosphomutase n=1 Tax=Halarsenatibacter silvermanii TaxID=321763 RepID=A0A1G9HD20_9FIRM|nr:isocitrate lyase/phosphoenolpyruvate mutase family protein [Halarsenatibacter silvermanii]SDL10393.1 Phosphoenolpyruvate phosphomutase [Halarsenatibacter silvermanii]